MIVVIQTVRYLPKHIHLRLQGGDRTTSLHELMELGGWSCYEMVLRYAHFASGHLLKAAQNIDDTNMSHDKDHNLKLVVSR